MSNTDDMRNTWETYVKSWKVSGEAEKRKLFAAALALQCVYRDPLNVAEGYDALCQYMLEFHEQVPGGHFVTQSFIAHHGRSMASWKMADADGNFLSDGASYAEYGADGKLIAMTGFFEPAQDG